MTDASRFRRELTELAEPVGHVLRTRSRKESRSAALPRAFALAAVVPVTYFALCLALRSFGIDFRVPLWVVVVVSCAVPLLYVLSSGWRGQRAVSEDTALAVIDDSLKLEDRLNTAHEFLGAAQPTPFMLAAIDDAARHSERAKSFAAPADDVQTRLAARHFVWPAVAVLALVASTWIGVRVGASDTSDEIEAQKTERVAIVDDKKAVDTDRPVRPDVKPTRRPEEERDLVAQDQKRGDSGVTEKNRKKSRGDEGSGKSSQAQSSSGQSAGEGQSTDQAQPTKGAEKKKSKPKPEKPAKDPGRKKKSRRPEGDKESVATSGQGKGKGSSRSPTASEWSSKDQSVADDEEELEDEDEVDDDDEESEARGGLQPSLRQRKPPVNRDLSIGFGGGKPPPSANGRGGAGLPKKQRGVAQLVLGIPYPDQITGKPNKGRTKVTQERIEPQAQTAPKAAAEARPERSSRLGHLSRPVLLPWMQDLVREYQKQTQTAPQEPVRGNRAR